MLKLWEKMDLESVGYLVFTLMVIVSAFGWVFFDFTLEVDPEYINGILTASSIIYGLWGFIISRTEKGMSGYFWKFNIIKVFTASFLFLAFSVFLLFLSGLRIIHPAYALYVGMNSFLLNAFAMTTTLHKALGS